MPTTDENKIATPPAPPPTATTVTRSLVLPIAGPQDASWPELREALRLSWGETTRCANWLITQLYLADVKRTADMKKLPPMPKTYFYREARALFPSLASASVNALEREVTRKYRARRYDLIWLQKTSLPVMRYPVGLPIPSQMWKLSPEESGAWLFSCRIGDRRFNLRLRGGAHFHRQLQALEKVLAGEVAAGAATLYQISSNENDNRSDAQPKKRLVVRIPVDLPIKERKLEGVLAVRTTRDALIVAGEGDGAWIEHNYHIRRAINAQMHQQRNLSEDLKAERRRPERQRQGIVERMGRMSKRHKERMRSWLHEVAAHLVGYAARQKFEAISYDDSIRSFCDRFPWHELRQRIAEKCEANAIQFIASTPVVEESPEALEEDGSKNNGQ